jgi:ATP-binding cassette subfamily F protein 3
MLLVHAANFPQTALTDMTEQFGSQSAIDFLRKEGAGTQTYLRSHLGKFGMKGSEAMRTLSSLSSRVWLAAQFLREDPPSLFVLDEVCENLDLATLVSLMETLNSFGGSVLAISHDEFFCKEFQPTHI